MITLQPYQNPSPDTSSAASSNGLTLIPVLLLIAAAEAGGGGGGGKGQEEEEEEEEQAPWVRYEALQRSLQSPGGKVEGPATTATTASYKDGKGEERSTTTTSTTM